MADDDDFTLQWKQQGLELCRAHRRDQWAIAEWYIAGADTRGRGWCKQITEQPEWRRAGGLEYSALKVYGSVARKFPPELRQINVAFSHYQMVRSLPIDQALSLLMQAESDQWVVDQTRNEARILRWSRPFNGTDIWTDLADTIEAGKKYRVVYADPPWDWNEDDRRGAPVYPLMPIEDICALPVDQIATDDAYLFLWCAPALFVDHGLRTLEAWGFKYKNFACWDKMTGNYGRGAYWRMCHAPLLLGVRPKSPGFADNSMSSMIRVPRSRIHSETPDKVYDRIERAAPGGPFIELFARKRQPGWSAFGNQLPPLDTDDDDEELMAAD